MKKLVLILSLGLTACGSSTTTTTVSETETCSQIQKPDGTLIVCPDGTSSFVSNSNGSSGIPFPSAGPLQCTPHKFWGISFEGHKILYKVNKHCKVKRV